MARGPVWIEAYEQYLLRKNVCEKSKLERLSDDALAEKYFQYVEETDCKEDTFDWCISIAGSICKIQWNCGETEWN